MSDKRIFIEERDNGDWAVSRAGAKRASAIESSQAKAIARARELEPGAKPHIERVRHTDKGGPDQWRKR